MSRFSRLGYINLDRESLQGQARSSQALLSGVDPLTAEVIQRCDPLWQPDVLLYGASLKPINLAELARRCFTVHYVQDSRMLWGSQCMEAGEYLLPHQIDRLHNTAGTYRDLRQPEASYDAAIFVMSAPFTSGEDLRATLAELRRAMRQRPRQGFAESVVLLRGHIPWLPKRDTSESAIPFTADGENWHSVWPLVTETGFRKLEPAVFATGLDIHSDPPTFTWRLMPA